MPRLFTGAETIPGLTWPTLTFTDRLTIDARRRPRGARAAYCGRGHTAGDIVAWLPRREILFAGDLVEAQAALYTGDAFHRDWATGTLDRVAAFGAEALVGGRGAVARGRGRGRRRASRRPGTSSRVMLAEVGAVHAPRRHAAGGVRRRPTPRWSPGTARWPIFEHCLPFDVHRLWDELDGIDWPRIWTAERDREVWADPADVTDDRPVIVVGAGPVGHDRGAAAGPLGRAVGRPGGEARPRTDRLPVDLCAARCARHLPPRRRGRPVAGRGCHLARRAHLLPRARAVHHHVPRRRPQRLSRRSSTSHSPVWSARSRRRWRPSPASTCAMPTR